MKLHLYAVHDTVAGEAGPLYSAKSDEVAIRMYKQLIKHDNCNPEEYQLWHVGVYETEFRITETSVLETNVYRVLIVYKEDNND